MSFHQATEKLCKEDEDPETQPESNGAEKPKSSWSEHTWSTFISREEEEEPEAPQGKILLSPFQKDKFIHFFYHVLDLNFDHVISQEDFDGLNGRVRHYMDWSTNNMNYQTLKEVNWYLAI